MIKSNEITVYSVKSTRSNAKITYKTFSVWSGEKGIKTKFREDDKSEIMEWLKRQPYTLYQLVVYHDNINLFNFKTKTFYSKESVLQVASLYMDLFNSEVIANEKL